MAGSLGFHLLVAVLFVALAASHPRAVPPPPRLTGSPVPVVVMTPLASAKPLPKPTGDLLVKASPTPTPTPVPTATPTPLATPRPSPSPSPRPSARPSPRPTPKPTPRPTPRPKATPTPTSAKAKAEEQRKFKNMRKFFSYFKDMSDEQLRKQPLPHGLKSWDDVVGIATMLDALPNFVPPPTNVSPEPGASPAVSRSPEGSPSPQPSPLEFDEPDGRHALAFQVENNVVTARWKPGDARAIVTFRPKDAPPEDLGVTFDVAYDPDRKKYLDNILQGYLKALAEYNAHHSPLPGASVAPGASAPASPGH